MIFIYFLRCKFILKIEWSEIYLFFEAGKFLVLSY